MEKLKSEGGIAPQPLPNSANDSHVNILTHICIIFINLRIQDSDLDRYTIILENVKERALCIPFATIKIFFFFQILTELVNYIYLFFLAVPKTYSNKECLNIIFYCSWEAEAIYSCPSVNTNSLTGYVRSCR